jgi:hypothetical protein
VEAFDQLGDLRAHDREDVSAASRGEGVEADEGFLARVMDMERRLIPVVRVRVANPGSRHPP